MAEEVNSGTAAEAVIRSRGSFSLSFSPRKLSTLPSGKVNLTTAAAVCLTQAPSSCSSYYINPAEPIKYFWAPQNPSIQCI